MTRLRYTLRQDRTCDPPIDLGFWISAGEHPGWQDADTLTVSLDFGALAPRVDTLLTVRDEAHMAYFRVCSVEADVTPTAAPQVQPHRGADEFLFIDGPAHGARLRLPHRPPHYEVPLLGAMPAGSVIYRRHDLPVAGDASLTFYAPDSLPPRQALAAVLELAAGARHGG